MDGQMKDEAAWTETDEQVYVNLQELTGTQSFSRQQGPQEPESVAGQETGSSSRMRAAALPPLALLGFLLLTAVIGLAVVYNRDFNQLSRQLANQTAERLQLLDRYRNLTDERDQLESSLTAAGSCPEGWRRFSCSCYFLSETLRSWQDSRQLCQQRGAELVIINSGKEMEFLKTLAEVFWIGLHQSSVGGSWIWPDGSSPKTTYWRPGQPYHYRTKRCAAFRAESWWRTSASWNSEDCYSYLNCVCEKDVF
ncbi:CD209 antigen-like protein E [Parambassis ranga]|uniref:CD209 antigen-like protein E n=1 Tax=Parambassis ranga TaxID=210632 RepID=A0A6P7IHB8_9TELE|nr:CD209 antigen-like protein E [Parambassis ranga]